MRVIVVDKSPERADLLREALRQAGHEVAAPLSASMELLRAIEELAPDVVVIDAASAVARLGESRRLRQELADANEKLAERKLVERAKGLLMKTRGLNEDAAYTLLRKLAMDRKLRLGELAQQLIDAAAILDT